MTEEQKLYDLYHSMKQRCSNPNSTPYPNYGGRGISFCDKWKTFAGFKEDMGKEYVLGLSLDRVNNKLGYSKENCRWATSKQQALNRSTTRWIKYKGMTKCLSDWATFAKIKRSTLAQRFYVYKWDFERCLTK